MKDQDPEDPLERFNRLLRPDDETQVDLPAEKETEPVPAPARKPRL